VTFVQVQTGLVVKWGIGLLQCSRYSSSWKCICCSVLPSPKC